MGRRDPFPGVPHFPQRVYLRGRKCSSSFIAAVTSVRSYLRNETCGDRVGPSVHLLRMNSYLVFYYFSGPSVEKIKITEGTPTAVTALREVPGTGRRTKRDAIRPLLCKRAPAA